MDKKSVYNPGHKLKVKKRQKKGKRNLFIFGLLLIAIAVGCVVFLNMNDRQDSAAAAATAEKTTAKTTVKAEGTTSKTESTTSKTESTTAAAKTVMAQLNSSAWYLTYVNKYNKMSDDYTPKTATVVEGSSQTMDYRVAPHYTEMYNAAKADGCTLTPCSGYRSYARQSSNYNNKVSYYEKKGYSADEAKAVAATIILPPGTSEHNLGFAMDIVSVENSFENTAEFEWLCEHAADYGFILRYPKDKTDITGITYEPWHWRYVGVKAAKEMKTSGQCLEQYLGLAK